MYIPRKQITMHQRVTFGILVFILCLAHVYCQPNIAACSRCADRQVTSTMVEKCKAGNQTGKLRVQQGCCVNTSMSGRKSIIGLDMSSCGLHTVTGALGHLHSLQVLLLDDNPDLRVTLDDFNGLSNLVYLSLPPSISCPGGDESWESTENKTSITICNHEMNLCVKHNVTCPNKNSHCVLMAPGEMQCLCNDGYHGYKCLRQGTFPYSGYFIVLVVCTVVISGFLWFMQRRHVKTVHSD